MLFFINQSELIIKFNKLSYYCSEKEELDSNIYWIHTTCLTYFIGHLDIYKNLIVTDIFMW